MRPWSSSLGRHHDSDDGGDNQAVINVNGSQPQNDGDRVASTLEHSAVFAAEAGAPAKSYHQSKEDNDDNNDSQDYTCHFGAHTSSPSNSQDKRPLASAPLSQIALLGEHAQGQAVSGQSNLNYNSCLMTLVPQDIYLASSDDDAEMSGSEGGAPLNNIFPANIPLGPYTTIYPSSTAQNHDSNANSFANAVTSVDYQTQHNTSHDATQAMEIDALSISDSQSETDVEDETTNVPFPIWLQEAVALDIGFDGFGPVQASNPNPTILGSENYGLVAFLRQWAYEGHTRATTRLGTPHIGEVRRQADAIVEDVTYEDLMGDKCDFQRLDWTSMQTTRDAARRRRRERYVNYVNRPGSDRIIHLHDRTIEPRDSFFRFKRMHFKSDISLAHFQLRSVLACPTRNLAYFSSPGGISRTDFASKKTVLALNLREFPAAGTIISTLDAGHGVLMGGTFNGDYCLKCLDSEDNKEFWEGQIASDAITNHLRIHTTRRSHSPVASIASNDHGFRVLDIETQKFVAHNTHQFALNCSALSPDGRLRVVVGDDPKVLIVNADSGEVLQQLAGHHDYGFACDWSEDGWTVATGFQDKAVKIWDARKWCTTSGRSSPLCSIRCEMAGARSLRFSPLGSGRPVLVAAEEADIINLIDAQTFCSKQAVGVFSEIGGVAFTNEGQDLNILCCDAHRGGLLQLERCGTETELFGRKWPLHFGYGTGQASPEQQEWPRIRKPVSVEDAWAF
ncbi:hypothetical protein CDD82_255 [Ophiocordyceps australis]|uniref:Uncharacterized protein n=1 Tax=Ophiocordyceps australis TaxID=1399860 RepID=A0A2C5ZNT3_9HYPO|nr:hypothetical protein CDD82_255 [Ophiocordyceps australis]